MSITIFAHAVTTNMVLDSKDDHPENTKITGPHHT